MRETKADILSDVDKEYDKARIIDRNTLEVFYKDGSRAIRFHHTDIITWMLNGDVILNSGGWQTSTTRERINKYVKLQIMQRDHVWWIFPEWADIIWNPKSPNFTGIKFYDGITFDSNLNLIGELKVHNEKAQNKLRRQINKYCKLVETMDELPYPSAGDCWYCSLISQEGKPLGDTTKNNSHLIQHMKEGYIHGSILVNAMKEAGYQNHQIGFHYQMANGKSKAWRDSFRRSLHKYLIKRLIANGK